MHFKLTVDSFLCILVVTSKISIAIDLTKFVNIPNFSQFLSANSANFCKPGFKMFRSYVACNGRIDCPDGSDETSQLCQDKKCSNSLFRCNYGACIGRSFVCNGAFDCADGSDEQLDLCRSAQCRVPFATTSTVYYAGDCEGQCGGFLAEDGTVLHYLCANNSSDTNFLTAKSICRNGFWRPGIPSCTGGNSGPSKSQMSAANGTAPNVANTPAAGMAAAMSNMAMKTPGSAGMSNAISISSGTSNAMSSDTSSDMSNAMSSDTSNAMSSDTSNAMSSDTSNAMSSDTSNAMSSDTSNAMSSDTSNDMSSDTSNDMSSDMSNAMPT